MQKNTTTTTIMHNYLYKSKINANDKFQFFSVLSLYLFKNVLNPVILFTHSFLLFSNMITYYFILFWATISTEWEYYSDSKILIYILNIIKHLEPFCHNKKKFWIYWIMCIITISLYYVSFYFQNLPEHAY